MGQGRKVLMFEANEIPFRVLDDYVHRKPQSNVARLLSTGKQFETLCEDQIELDPWISWSTLHRGVIDQQHQVLHLGQSLEAANDAYPPLWDILAKSGKRVGVMGALHSSTLPSAVEQYAFYVPDFFADKVFAHPQALAPFQAFNLAMTRSSTRNVSRGVALKEAIKFLLKYIGQGMSLSTLRTIAKVLLAERQAPHLKTRRRALQPMITLDLFLHFTQKTLPDFATMHANHVAAAMHRYWSAAFPEDGLGTAMSAEWHAKYNREISFAMDVFDEMIGRLMAFVEAHPDYKLVIVSSLGQAGVTTRPTPGFVSIRNLPQLMRTLGVADGKWTERFAMAPCVAVVFDDVAEADAFERKLLSISVGDSAMRATPREVPPLAFDRKDNSFLLYFYFENYQGDGKAKFGDQTVSFEQLGLAFHPHEDGVACSGRHTPDGILLAYDPKQRAADHARARISTLDIAPAVLQEFGIEPKPYMHAADASLLDASAQGTHITLQIEGGGVEKSVRRLTAIA